MPNIIEYSTVIRIFLIKAGIIRPHVALERTVNKHPETYYGDDFLKQKLHKKYPEGIFEKISAKQMLMTNKQKYFKRNMENIVVIAKHRGIKTIIATFAYSSLFNNKPRVSSEEYISTFDEMNKTLRTIATETGVNLFDYANIFPKDKKYYIDGRHVTIEGARLQAKLFAQYIIKENLIPRREY